MGTRIKAPTEADIFSTIVGRNMPTLSAAAARSLLRMRFTTAQERRMHELAEKNNAGTMTEVERAEMENFLRVGNFLSLVQSKARLSLKASTRS